MQIRFVNEADRVEILFRKHAQTKLLKLFDIVKKDEDNSMILKVRLLEEKIKMNDHALLQSKLERMSEFEKEKQVRI